MKKRLACGMGLMILICGLAGCAPAQKEQAPEMQENGAAEGFQREKEDLAKDESEKETEQANLQTETPLQKAYEEILEHGTSEFLGNYPIDEVFLDWFLASYGEETLERLTDKDLSEERGQERWYELTGNTIHVLWLMYCRDMGINQQELENVYWMDCASEERTVLDFAGDFNFSEGWGTMRHLDSQPNGIYDCFSGELLSEMQSADIMVINNEFTYSNRGTPLEGKSYTFRANPERVKLLEAFGTDIVSLANNHVYDYGEEALIDTLETLEGSGVPYVGAGRNLEEAKKIVYFIANGRKIAITAASQIERSSNYTKEATEDSAGVLKTLNPDKYVEVIKTAEENSDIVIAYVHWGTEHQSWYGADQESLADAFVEAGVDVIIGGHTHCLQGMAYKNGVPILYSLGNFWFNQKTLDTGLAQVLIEKDGSIGLRFLPCIQQNYKTVLVTGETEKQRILDYMKSISSGVSIDEEGYVRDLATD